MLKYAITIDMSIGNSAAPWFVFHGRKILARPHNNRIELPCWSCYDHAEIPLAHHRFFPERNDQGYYGALAKSDLETPQEFAFVELRSILGVLNESTFRQVAAALQLTEWSHNTRLCSKCGKPLENISGESGRTCPSCNLFFFPPVSPAVIVVILKGDYILLAHNRRFSKDMYSLIAGFVDPGETLEECVRREIAEEVGIQVDNISYFSSQPWPFPHSLMIGFIAHYVGGSIKVDGEEITDAAWFHRTNMPGTPPPGSISTRMIEWYKQLGRG
jgi:NAD+ diphosphatase